MSLRLTIFVAAAAVSVAAPASADPQGGHLATHITAPTSGGSAPAPAPKPTGTTSTTTASTTTTSSTAVTATSPVAAKISTMPQLHAKVTALLPPHMTLNSASAGFRNQGQFIAALHVSRNLGIPFAALKSDMTTKHMSLGQSIHAWRKTADAPREAKKGEAQAATDLRTPKHRSGQ
jgi:hypothetical protein